MTAANLGVVSGFAVGAHFLLTNEAVKTVTKGYISPEHVLYVAIVIAVIAAALLPLVLERTVGELLTGTVILKDISVVDVEISFEEEEDDDEDDEDSEDEEEEDEDVDEDEDAEEIDE